jgi:cobyrinic acid a,c-diamide synthase
MQRAIEGEATVYGECGGYMVRGEGLIDGRGGRHEMLGALPLVTSFKERRRTLGYRRIVPRGGFVWSAPLTAHEFHYSSVISEGEAERLFDATDAIDEPIGAVGLRCGRVAGSFMHVIDLAADNAR